MKIRVSYNFNGLEFLGFVEAPNIEEAKKRFRFASVIKENRVMIRSNLVFEYEELIEASKLTPKGRNSYAKRMLLFMKHCPSFEIVKRPYRNVSMNLNYKEPYQVKYLGNEAIISLSLSIKTKYPYVIFFRVRPKAG